MMRPIFLSLTGVLLLVSLGASLGVSLTRREDFSKEPLNWEGVNNRNTNFGPKTVSQDFGYSPAGRHAGGQPGEIGGKINPAGEPAYYAFPLPLPVTFNEAVNASGTLFVPPGPGHFLLGWFNTNSLSGWRTPNTMVVRINGRGEGFHSHLE